LWFLDRAVKPGDAPMAQRDEAPRDLLFGLLALHNAMVTRDELVAAFGAWTASDRPLADLLVEHAKLSADERALLAAVVDNHLRRHGGELAGGLAALDMDHSTLESLAAAGGPKVEASLAQVGSGARSFGSADRTITYAVGTAPAGAQRFRILRPHARGGLGAVFVALDSELNREVALKQILDGRADDPVSRQRFLVEAEITGGLEHPGIVPVYGLGTYGDGRPYYAMRFIRGDSLKEAVAGFHNDDLLKRDLGARTLALQKLLRRFLDVCYAVDYAHGRGVLHRDLKPANIIVGKYGETLVVDWGLAKASGRNESIAATEERPLVPSSASGSAKTLPGSALGTPAYMSPEQARGDVKALGPRSDVYSLGATLYCLLTGRPPFAASDPGDVLRAVERGDFPRPKAVDGAAPSPLDAVCLKAMARNPEDRYATPRALAEDVERWIADGPVSAYRDPWSTRVARWSRRHKPAVAAMAAVLVATVAGLSIGTVVLRQANVQIERQRRLAQANFRQARAAVDDYLTKVSEDRLLKSNAPGMQALRKELLESARQYYQAFVDAHRGDPALKADLAAAQTRVATIAHQVGSRPEALSSFQAARDLWASLARNDPANAHYQLELAHADASLGKVQLDTVGQARESKATLEAAVDRLERLSRSRPDDAEVLDQLAGAVTSLSLWYKRSPQSDQAHPVARRALDLRERAAKLDPKQQNKLASILLTVGYGFTLQGRAADALSLFERAQKILEPLVASRPGDAELRRELARAYTNLGYLHHSQTRRIHEALRQFERSAQLCEQLVRENPIVPSYRSVLASQYKHIAEVLMELGEFDRAADLARRSVDASVEVAKIDPDDYSNHMDQVYAYMIVGQAELARGRPAAAEEPLRKATEVPAKLLASHRDDFELVAALSRVHRLRGQAYGQSGRTQQALESFRRSLSIYAEAESGRSVPPYLLPEKAAAYTNLGAALNEAGKLDEAVEAYRQALTIRDTLAQAQPTNERFQYRRAEAMVELGRIQLASGRTDEAIATLGRSVEAFGVLVAGGPIFLASRAEARATLVAAFAARPAPTQPERDEQRRAAELAVVDLREAVGRGQLDPRALKFNPAFKALRDHEDFRLLVRDLAFPAKPFATPP
jgi:eukaryotic-like serine/threonine-protein kinase